MNKNYILTQSEMSTIINLWVLAKELISKYIHYELYDKMNEIEKVYRKEQK